MSQSNNSHNWYGLISTYTNKFWDNKLSFLAGIDMRYYIGKHNNKIVDLYDGAYYIDDLNRGSVDYLQKKFFTALAHELKERDEAQGKKRIRTT